MLAVNSLFLLHYAYMQVVRNKKNSYIVDVAVFNAGLIQFGI